MQITFKIRDAVQSGEIVLMSALAQREHTEKVFGEGAEYVTLEFRPKDGTYTIIRGGDVECPDG